VEKITEPILCQITNGGTIAVCDFSRCGVGTKFSRLKNDKWRISRSSLIEVSNIYRYLNKNIK
jgi:hypothetical protein